MRPAKHASPCTGRKKKRKDKKRIDAGHKAAETARRNVRERSKKRNARIAAFGKNVQKHLKKTGSRRFFGRKVDKLMLIVKRQEPPQYLNGDYRRFYRHLAAALFSYEREKRLPRKNGDASLRKLVAALVERRNELVGDRDKRKELLADFLDEVVRKMLDG